jgi:hypothetical protein
VLRDTTSFGIDDVAFTDGVEQGRLSVVDMTHNHHYWWSFDYVWSCCFGFFGHDDV